VNSRFWVGVDVKGARIEHQPVCFLIEDHWWNLQGGVRMTAPPGAGSAWVHDRALEDVDAVGVAELVRVVDLEGKIHRVDSKFAS
jgi:hypothetical protein